MKKIFLISLIILCIFSSSVIGAEPGDLNDDGSINSTDYILLRRYVIDLTEDINIDAAELNGDNKIDSMDYIFLRRYLLGMIAEFPGGNTVVEVPWHPGNGSMQMENLDRGLVAVNVDNGVFVSWRMFGTDPDNIAFNLYRDGNKVNNETVVSSTNYLDSGGNINSSYYIRPVWNEQELKKSKTVSVWQDNYLEISISPPAGGTTPDGVNYTYAANDLSVGDLNGDGQYELILKWDPSNSKDNAHSGYTGNVYLDAYKLDGTQLWRIDLGRNIRAGAHYTQFMVYDLDGNGRAEIVMKTADGTVDGRGNIIGNPGADYRNSSGYVLDGPEFLTVFDGLTGKALSTINYEPPRGRVSDWGDNYGNRVDRFLAGIAYLDGQRPSVVMCRGYYTRTVLAAYNWRDGNLQKLWTFDSNDYGNHGYAGQGNHQLSVADVDNDGKHEIIYGACAIDNDGTGLYSTGLGHGDALHVSNMDPDRPGLEIWNVHEEYPLDAGSEFRDAGTGQLIFGIPSNKDVGRGMAADIDPRYKGYELWSSASGGVYNVNGNRIASNTPSINFGIWWDGDLLRELLDSNRIDKWDWNSNRSVNVFTARGCLSNNGTKATPGLSADTLGDWREEVVFRREDNRALRIYTTTDLTEHRIYTLMHDPQYRTAVAWQNVAYNQPPHPSFYLGDGMSELPQPDIYLIGGDGNSDSDVEIPDVQDNNGRFDGCYTIKSKLSGKIIEVYGASTESTADIVQGQYTGAGSQLWELNYEGDGCYSIISRLSGKALEIYEHSLDNGAFITQWEYWGGDNQLWRIEEQQPGYYSIISKLSEKALDVYEWSLEDGAVITQWDYSGGDNQLWKIEEK